MKRRIGRIAIAAIAVVAFLVSYFTWQYSGNAQEEKAVSFEQEVSAVKPLEYTIPYGSNLTKISVTFRTTPEAIMKLNAGNPAIKNRDIILAGYRIYIPVYPEAEVTAEVAALIATVDTLKKTIETTRTSKVRLLRILVLLSVIFAALAVLMARKIYQLEKQRQLRNSNPMSVMSVIESYAVQDVLKMLNTPAIGEGRNPKMLKKLSEYLEEIRKTMSPENYEEMLMNPLKNMPGYRLQFVIGEPSKDKVVNSS